MNYEVYTRKDPPEMEMLVVLEDPIPFSRLVPVLVREFPRASIYSIVCRSVPFGSLEHAVFHLLMRWAYGDTSEDIVGYDPQQKLPHREETRFPSAIPVTVQGWESWEEADGRWISILSSSNGWDWYDVDWLLQKWESALGLIDDDVLYLSIPVYPLDLYNQRVPPEVIFREVRRYVRRYGMVHFRTHFFALYLLTQDHLGRELLSFFYHHRGEDTPVQLLETLWDIRSRLPVDHYYRPYLLEKNYSVLDIHRHMTFKPYMMINQFLSYHGMYVSKEFYTCYRHEILTGFLNHRKELHMVSSLSEENTVAEEDAIDGEMRSMFSRVGDKVQWIGKWHLETFLSDSLWWRTLLGVWDFIPRRNLYLWERTSFRYNEFQMRVGHEFRLLFDTKTLRTMNRTQKKKFDEIFSTLKKNK